MEKRQRNGNPWALVLLIVFVCFVVAYSAAYIATRTSSAKSFGRVTMMNIANLQDLGVTSDGFVYYDGSTVARITSSGRPGWSFMVGENAGLDVSDNGVAIWRQGNQLTLLDGRTGEINFNGAMDAEIISAHMDANYTAVLTGTETNGTMILMENSGRQVSQIILDDVTVIDYGFFSNGTLLWVMLLDSNGTAPTCEIQTYRPGKEIVGLIHDNEQLSYAVLFQSSQVLVAGDTYLRAYDYTGTEDASRRRLVYGWYLASFDSTASDPLMVFVNDAQLQGPSDIRDIRLLRTNLDRVVRMPFGCMSVLARGNEIFGFTADGHMIQMATDQASPKAYQLELTNLDHVYGATRDGYAVLGAGETIYLVSLE